MICRQITFGVVKLDHEALANFDWFNDYKDTRGWLESTHPHLVDEFDETYEKWKEELEVLPCPFCGSENLGIAYVGQPASEYAILCGECGARGPMVPVGGTASGARPTLDNPEALKGWNRRAGKPEQTT